MRRTDDAVATQPSVHVRPARSDTRGVALLLHGGKPHSTEPARLRDLSARRMRPLARELHRRAARDGIAVWSIQYRMRGWNGSDRSPVHDARWALARVREVHGEVPVVLVGHSMGGRVAVSVLDDPRVIGMAALAPWLPDEPTDGAVGKDVLVVHGEVDRWTSPEETLRWAAEARLVARSLSYIRVRRSGHFMLRRERLWTDLTVLFTLRAFGLDTKVGATATRALARAKGVPVVTV